jgi:hypothetical protein
VLLDLLGQDYPPEHEVILYRAATLPIDKPHVLRTLLKDLPSVGIDLADTLVIPPARALEANAELIDRLARLDERRRVQTASRKHTKR